MLENFIYAKQKSLFEEALNNGQVLDEAIVFIEDTKEIWNHGTYFDGSTVDLSNIEASIQNILDNIPTKVSDLENDSGFITGEILTEVRDTLMSGPIQSLNNRTTRLENDKANKTELPTKVSELENDSNYLITESDPVFTASVASGITSENISDWNNKQNKNLYFNNLTASSWVEDTTYTDYDYSYRCDIACSGVTVDMYAEVAFAMEQATSGNYAPVCETKEGVVSVWSKKDESIVIPVIMIIK